MAKPLNRAPLAALVEAHPRSTSSKATSGASAHHLLPTIPPGPPVEPVARGGLLPVSFAQHRLWLLGQLFPDSYVYNEPIQIHMEGAAEGDPVDASVLADCLTEITRRHEAWRTVFPSIGGEPMQEIGPPRSFALDVVELSHQVSALSAAEVESEAMRLAVEHARRPFDLRKGPLVRALLIRTGRTSARLIVTAHHIIVDGVSFFNVFLPELSALYAAFSRREPSPLSELPLHYADFAVWQRRWLTDAELAPKLAYWQEQLAAAAELGLPTDFPRPAEPTGQGAREPIALSVELTEKLRELGHRAGVTLFTTLLAAWKTLLFRYVGHRDIVVGSAAAGRPRPEFERLLGFFSNNLVLRTRLDGSLSFLALLERVDEVLQAARSHQDLPFERLAAALKRTQSPYRTPFYDNTFILMPPLPALNGTSSWSASRFDIGAAKVDLYLELHRRSAGLVGHIEYQTELFSAATIKRMIGHFEMLLAAIVRDPSQRLSELPLLTEAEARMLAVWQGPAAAVRSDAEAASLEALFSAQAARTPKAIAIEHGSARLTYAELDARANQLAHFLRKKGVGPDTLVGLYIERSLEAMVAILGVLKAGGAYVPLDPAYPHERLRFMLEDADIPIVLATTRSAAAIPAHRSQVVLIDADWQEIAQHGTSAPQPLASASHLAYVIYTSGSTGRPKGVEVERRGLYHLAKAQERSFGLGVGSRVLQFFSLAFDGSVWDLTMTWPVGATLVLADREALVPGSGLVELLKKLDIHAVMVTPSGLAVMPKKELPALRVLIAGGEALPKELVERWAPGRRLFNAYGPTEITVACSVAECRAGEGNPSIGRPFEFVSVRILDQAQRPVPIGVPGELYIGGPGVARGYRNCPELTASRFLADPFAAAEGVRLYRTGDVVKWLPDGSIAYLGRTDQQVKLRGFRIELGEIEAELVRHPAVQTAVAAVLGTGEEKRLIAYIVPCADGPAWSESSLKQHLRERLAEPMVPATIVPLDRMPLMPNGKVDRAALPVPAVAMRKAVAADGSLEELVADVWAEVLGVTDIGIDRPFFEVGGHSLAFARVQAKLASRLKVDVGIMTLMRLPTIRRLAAHLATLPELAQASKKAVQHEAQPAAAPRTGALAIVGMAVRAPGVRGPHDLWEVVRAGRETIRVLSPEALIAAGADPERVRRPNFVPAEGVLEDADRFDAAFFGYSDADAAIMDPQQRLFLECVYEALEHSGHDPGRFAGRIGVFGGAGVPRYWMGPVLDKLRRAGSEQDAYRAQILNAPDFLATRVAFKLGLRGPAVAVQTACSTSLAAVHVARQSLLSGECDMAVAGGVSVTSLRDADRGYLCIDGGIESADGHCRPFDAEASGFVRSSGVATVVLKRLADALADGDTIHALLLGSAMNNDGAEKVGFTAPSEERVAAAVEEACRVAGIDPRSVGLLEAHGTGTRLGDPTEVSALTRAYRVFTKERGYCALGSLKANLGHLDAAAGAASLIKATLALAEKTLPPVANFCTPNPLLELPSTPFFIADTAREWPRKETPRRAGVSALGLGGTNVHVVLEEAPPQESAGSRRPCQLLCLSAATEQALVEAGNRLRDHLAAHPSLELADVAHTLALGRVPKDYRTTLVCRDISEAVAALGALPQHPVLSENQTLARSRQVVFLFPGHGAQYLQMGRGIYDLEPDYRAAVDQCLALLAEQEELDLRPLFEGTLDTDGERLLDEMQWAQPFLFTVEYALAKLLLSWGVRPVAMLGHSLGEYVAACVAGVLSLSDALALVVARGRLMEKTPPGGMITAFADEQAVVSQLAEGAAIATYAPGCVVISGLTDAIEATRQRLAMAGIETSRVRVSRASHSPVMHQIRQAFRLRVAAAKLRPPAIPIISNLTGMQLTAEQATSPDYWADHLCNGVRLSQSLATVFDLASPLAIEIGPGGTLSSFLKAHPRHAAAACESISMLPNFRMRHEAPHGSLFSAIGRLWELGVELDWRAFYSHEQRRRVPLPTYPFQGRRHLLEPAPAEKTSRSLDARASEIAAELGARTVDHFPGLRLRLEELSASLVLDFFARRLGEDCGRPRLPAALQRDAGILPKFTPMFELLMRVLECGGLAERTPRGELLLAAERARRSAELSRELAQDVPAFAGLVRFLKHCVDHYDEALTGIGEPVGVLYPDGTNAFYRQCVAAMPASFHDVYMALAREAVLDAVAERRGQRVRILEVGAGHGALTWPLVEQLRGQDVEYHFTDIGRSFLHVAAAEAERRGLPFLKALRFDLNRPPQEQALASQYDLILGIDSVHVAVDLPTALANLRRMLAPGGAMIFVEATRVETWHQLIWGLAPGYWDVVNARSALTLELERWQEYLTRAGFVGIEAVPKDGARRKLEDCSLLIAKPGKTAELPRLRTCDSAAAKREDGESMRTMFAAAPAQPTERGATETGTFEDVEPLVRGLWERMLGASNIPSNQSFFALGGDSLLAVHFLAELRLKTGRELAMRRFLAQPTVDGVVSMLRRSGLATRPGAALPETIAKIHQSAPRAEPGRAEKVNILDQSAVPGLPAHSRSTEEDCLVPLQKAGAKRPFFCVHPIDGEVLCYAALASALQPYRPFIGIQAPMRDAASTRPHSIEELAARYLRAVRRAQPAGPYLLGGWSFGGLVALEMARQLVQMGERVAHLVLFDVAKSPSSGMELLHRVDRRLPSLSLLPALLASSGRKEQSFRQALDGEVSHLASTLSAAAKSLVLADHHLALWRSYTPSAFLGAVTHFRAEKRPLGVRILAGSQELPLGAMCTLRVPGDHFSMLTGENARPLATRLGEVLDAAEESAADGTDFAAAAARERDEASLREFLDRFVNAMRNRDGAALARMYVPDERSTLVTSSPSVLVGAEIIAKHYRNKTDSLQGVSVHVHEARVFTFSEGRSACITAWLDSDQTFSQDERRVSYRGTRLCLVLERHGDAWLAIHMHYSLPVGDPVETLE